MTSDSDTTRWIRPVKRRNVKSGEFLTARTGEAKAAIVRGRFAVGKSVRLTVRWSRPHPDPLLQERIPRTLCAPCAPELAGVRSARRPGAQQVRMQSATWGGFRHEQAVGAAATGDRSRSKGGFMGRETWCAAW